MINRIFSIFDPSSTLLISNSFFVTILLLFFLPVYSRLIRNRTQLQNLIIVKIKQEVAQSNPQIKGNSMISITLFLILAYTNVIALYPQNFANSAQVTFSLALALVLWLRRFSQEIVKNTIKFIQHLVPQGTPPALMHFIVIIELVSNLIRPITLCVRLTANILAGHLLMSLLRNFIINVSVRTRVLLIAVPFLLTGLETAVALIQAYVFITLITLYTNENK